MASAKDLVKRGHEVWVKVISPPNAQRLSLSMRDVDQSTGKDLLPRPPQNSSQNPRGPDKGAGNSLRGLSGKSADLEMPAVEA